MCESVRKLVRVGASHISRVCAPTTLCFDVFNRSYNTEPRNMELVAKLGSGKDWGFTICRGMSRSCCKRGHDVPGTYAPDPYRFVSSINCSRCGSSYYNRLHRD